MTARIIDFRKVRDYRRIIALEVTVNVRPRDANIHPSNPAFVSHAHAVWRKKIELDVLDFKVSARYVDNQIEKACSARIAQYEGGISALFDYEVCEKYQSLHLHHYIMAIRSAFGCFASDENTNDEIVASTHDIFKVPIEKIRKLGGKSITCETFDRIIEKNYGKLFFQLKDSTINNIRNTLFEFDLDSLSNIINPVLEDLSESYFTIYDGLEYRRIPIYFMRCHIFDGAAESVYDYISGRLAY